MNYSSVYPNLQFEFLMKNVRRIKEWTPIIKLKFLRLAATFQPEKVSSILLYDRFPLDEALEICQEFNNMHGIALIQLKIGQYNEVGNTYIKASIT
jgi:hypothetical protein